MSKFFGSALLAVIAAFWATSANALAYFTPLNSDPMFQVTVNQHPLGRVGVDITPLAPTGQANIKFYFTDLDERWVTDAAALNALGGLDAHLSFIANERPFPNDKTYQTMASIVITYAGSAPLVINGKTYNTGALLLDASSSIGRYYGGATGGAVSLMSAPTSDFGNTGYPWGYVFSMGFSRQSGDVTSYTASLNSGSIGYAVPEPATWAMMIIGFGAVGSMVRTSRRRTAFCAA